MELGEPEETLLIEGRIGRARVWTARDVERVRKWKAALYRKGRGRKKKA